MSHSDSNFYKPFAIVLGALVIFTLFIAFIANVWSPDSGEDPLVVAQQKKALQPVGRSRVAGGSDVMVADTDAQKSAENKEMSKSGEANVGGDTNVTGETSAVVEKVEVPTAIEADSAKATVVKTGVPASVKVKAAVLTNCAGCHNIGLDGAAKSDDKQAWSALADKGIDQLTESVINGKGSMPPRAESSLNDSELRQAVELMMLNASGESVSANGASAAVTTTASTAAVVSETAGSAENKKPVPDEVKKVVDSTCAACHIAGVANAPKFSDKAAWEKRMEKGLDAVTASAIAGIGGMPPRGGSSLDDDQMKLAIEYMLSK